MEAEKEQQYVTTMICQDRHSTSKWMFGILTGLMSVFMVGISYSVNSAHEALKKNNVTSTTLESHVTAEVEMRRLIKERLDEIKQDVRDNRTLLDEILRNGKGK